MAAPLPAQGLRPSTTGLSVAASAGLARATSETDGTSGTVTEIVPRIEVAYGVTPRFSMLIALSRSTPRVDDADYSVRNVDMGVRYLGYAGRPLRPFVEGGLSIRKFSLTDNGPALTSQDVGAWGAAGGMWFPGARIALEAAATYGRVQFESWRADGLAPTIRPVTLTEIGVRAGVRLFARPR
ncbi:MAG: hypothetical protein ACK5BA_10610 [Gemmatimonas sp.]|jgi:hypothetical protein